MLQMLKRLPVESRPIRPARPARPAHLALPPGSLITCLPMAMTMAMVMVMAGCRRSQKEGKAAASCPSPAPARIVRLDIKVGTPRSQQPMRLERPEIEATVRDVLASTDAFSLDLSGMGACGEAYSAKVDLDFRQIVFGDKGRASVMIAMIFRRLEEPEEEELISRGEARRVFDVAKTANLESFYRDLLERGLEDVFRYIVAERKLKHAPPRAVATAIETGLFDPSRRPLGLRPVSWQPPVAAVMVLSVPGLGPAAAAAGLHAARQTPAPLADDAESIQEMAIRTAALRKLSSVTDSLLYVLRFGSKARLRDQALGALVEIGDEGVVPSLIRHARYQGPDELRRLIEAIARLGGSRARAFLELTADGHPDREIRKMARSALRRLKEKKEKKEKK